ncbi:MAG: toll/interleukin-1 receptor domain-containing protein [Nitrospirales bacterium]|nr:toll/interleukin-1 receptor domain-containing protein [Nitrospirales bacterium]
MPTFISHSFKDEAVYTALCLALDAAGIDRWDPSSMSLGESLSDQLHAAIRKCEICVLIATRRSIDSPWCLAELGAFWGAGKKVLMFMTDPDLEDYVLPPQFKGTVRANDAKKLIEELKNAKEEFHRAQSLSSHNPQFFSSSAEYGSEKDWESLLIETSSHFDLLGLTLDQWRRTNKFKEKVLDKADTGCKFRFLLMHQDNKVLPALFDDTELDSVCRAIQDSVSDFSTIRHPSGNVAVRQLHSGLSHFSLTRSDHFVVITQYMSSADWGYGPTWRCDPGSLLYRTAIDEFEYLWTSSKPIA